MGAGGAIFWRLSCRSCEYLYSYFNHPAPLAHRIMVEMVAFVQRHLEDHFGGTSGLVKAFQKSSVRGSTTVLLDDSATSTPAHASASSSFSNVGDVRRSISAILRLREDGCTLPFVVRYRGSAIGGVDEQVVTRVFDAADEFASLQQKKVAAKAKLQKLMTSSGRGAVAVPPVSVWRKLDDAWTAQDVKDIMSPYTTSTSSLSLATRAVEKGLLAAADSIWGAF